MFRWRKKDRSSVRKESYCRRVYGGVSRTFLSKGKSGWIIPIIFSSAIMMLPQFIATAFPEEVAVGILCKSLCSRHRPSIYCFMEEWFSSSRSFIVRLFLMSEKYRITYVTTEGTYPE